MRNVCLKALVLASALIGWATTATRSEAQIITNLITFTNTWKYDQSGLDLGTAWRSNSFSDTAWASGPGLLGKEPKPTDNPPGNPEVYVIHAPIKTVLKAGSETPPGPVTAYFRTKFNFSGTTNNLILVSTNLLDDGAVIYLNGAEVGRFRVDAGQNYTTLSIGTFTEGQLDTVVITNVTLLNQGENLMAVELHQSGTASSDLMFGMRLMGIFPTPLAITSQPQSVTAAIGDPSVTVSVGVSGGPVSYRWQKSTVIPPATPNWQFFPNATNSSFVQAPVALSVAGAYRVIGSNGLGSVTSTVAVIAIVMTPPGLRSGWPWERPIRFVASR